ncbi:MAG: hypothetical protein COX81_01900 [Candidatus Magasanikbacteria bacterium CG_4_10_14_0_2_um_filter_37_12]|uniref:Glycosyltransferase family 1 protein n=1 Tax=Candidatus Magasanikbacteria bacterium CG_4_10_14_0_2_um_filter_37_12 TaxID=1974637 RepID=A0A2M7V8A8_9BACT|nr:MAG: hypothetical protein COX81_01900 [Candidatus Magasanikbacteria bacterium CG_4_10_14_0_2_um_filter_37_12]
MIIGIDASRANHEYKTGVEWYAYFVIEELKKSSSNRKGVRDFENLEFVLYTDKPLQGKLAKLPDRWNEKVLRWPPKRFWTQIRMSWEMFRHPPDVLFIPAHVFPIIHPKKTVVTIHDIAATKFPESYNWFERWYSVWSAKFALKKLWKIIVPSHFTKNELTSVFDSQTSADVDVVHHGYDKKYRKIENKIKIGEVLKKYGIEKPFLMTVGRLEEKKNTWHIIQAFENLRVRSPKSEVRLILVGKPGYGYEKVQQAIENSKYKNDIITPGWVDEEDVPYIMNVAEVFVFPSLYEGFGIPILEAMACGTPVVTSCGSSLEEVGEDACVYVDPENIQDIAEAVVKLIENIEYRMSHVEKGIRRAENFSWEKCATETLNILLSEF